LLLDTQRRQAASAPDWCVRRPSRTLGQLSRMRQAVTQPSRQIPQFQRPKFSPSLEIKSKVRPNPTHLRLKQSGTVAFDNNCQYFAIMPSLFERCVARETHFLMAQTACCAALGAARAGAGGLSCR